MDYKFLIKPTVYIISILASCWMTLKIETLSPSDFNKGPSFVHKKHSTHIKYQFVSAPLKVTYPPFNKIYLKNLCNAYKDGKIDSTVLDDELTRYISILKNYPANMSMQALNNKEK